MGREEGESLLPDYSERSRSGQPRPEPVIDPERVALENNVRVSDSTIRALEKKMVKTREAYDVAEDKYEASKLSQTTEKMYFQVEADRLKKKNKVIASRVKALQRDMTDTSASKEYATLIVEPPKDKRDKEKMQKYVLKLQKQVIEAVENMQSAPKKLSIMLDNFDEAVTTLRKQLMELMQDRSHTEVQLMKQINILKDEMEEMEERYQERIQDSEERLKTLKAKWEKAQTFEDLEDELEEADAKLEELQELHAEQEKTIKDLEAKRARP